MRWTSRSLCGADLSVYNFPRAERLELSLTDFDPENSLKPWAGKKGKPVEAYLGVDIGSTTTKYALISEKAQILHKCYVPTQGKPIEVTQRLLRTLHEDVGQKIKLMAIATTGSGRNVVGDFLECRPGDRRDYRARQGSG